MHETLDNPSTLVDVQFNGQTLNGKVIDFSSPRLGGGDVERVLQHQFSRGTVICPTMITQPWKQLLLNARIIARALVRSGQPGKWQHIEGPFFVGTPGAIGAHPPQCCRTADPNLVDQLVTESENSVAILTVGADVPGICKVIERAVQHGIVVSLGHHVPTIAQLQEAIAAGATWLTHVGNGCPRDGLPRQGWPHFQLVTDRLGKMAICDGTHVEDYYLELVLRTTPRHLFVAVSDAAPLACAPVTPDGQWVDLWGSKVRVAKHPTLNTNMILGENGYFAGSWEDMLGCMLFLARRQRLPADATAPYIPTPFLLTDVGFRNPLRLLGKSPAELASLPITPVNLEQILAC